jgi:hypothetical protein
LASAFARCALGLLAAVRTRQGVDLDDDLGDMRGRGAACDLLSDAHRQATLEARPGGEHDEQHETRRTARARRALLDGHRLLHLRDPLQCAVDLGRAHAHPADLEYAIRPSVHPRLTVALELDQVAVRPRSGVLCEVGTVKLRAVGVADESDRPRRKRVATDELADGG